MADKQASLRHRILRGRRKSADMGDNSDSASDSSHTKKDPSNSTDSLSPAQPVARPSSRSPSARVPRKLQKKRSNVESSTPSPSLMPFDEQHDKSPSSEPNEPAVFGRSRAEIRRQERRQLKAMGPGSTVATKSRKQTEANNSDQNKDIFESSLAKPSYEENGDGLSLMEVSPLSINSELSMSDIMDESNSERRKSDGPALDTEANSIKSPDYNDPNPRVGRVARAKALKKLSTQSPVSPPRASESKTRDSPVSPLEDSPEGSIKDQEAPLLPHERMEPSTTYLEPGHTGKLRKKPSLKSKIPTLKLNTTDLDEATGSKRDENGKNKDGNDEEDDDDIHHNAVAAENALLETLRRITSKKQPHTDTEIRAATDEVLRTAASVLDLGPRSPVLSQLAPPPLLLPPAPEATDLPTANPHLVNPAATGCDCCGGHCRRSISSGRSLLEDVDEEDSNNDHEHKGRHRQRQAPVGVERIKHPINVTYDRPIVLATGIAQRGFRRWKCCRCHRYTHYENHVCSKLDCLHARCESRCEAFEP